MAWFGIFGLIGLLFGTWITRDGDGIEPLWLRLLTISFLSASISTFGVPTGMLTYSQLQKHWEETGSIELTSEGAHQRSGKVTTYIQTLDPAYSWQKWFILAPPKEMRERRLYEFFGD